MGEGQGDGAGLRITRRRWVAAASGAAAWWAMSVRAATPADAAWPSRPVHLFVAYPPGGVSDVVARALARELSARWSTPVVVEHKPGASGALAMAFLARASADGYTLCFSAITPLTLLPHLAPVAYDPRADIAPVVGVMTTPAMVVATQLAPRGDTLAEVLAAARKAGQALRWATTGVGTTGHLILEQVRRQAQSTPSAEIVHVPYHGGGQPLTDALGGHFELLSTNVGPQQLALLREGRLKALGVGAPRRLPALPTVPTLAEQGFAAANLASHFGLFAPAKTPPAVLARINADVNWALAQPFLRGVLASAENLPAGGSVQDFEKLIADEDASYRNVGNAVNMGNAGSPPRRGE